MFGDLSQSKNISEIKPHLWKTDAWNKKDHSEFFLLHCVCCPAEESKQNTAEVIIRVKIKSSNFAKTTTW